MSDGLVDAALAGENFGQTMKNVLQSFLTDLLKAIVQQLILNAAMAVTKSFGLTSLTTTVPAAAHGGRISGPTLVGEKGPEIFVPNGSGFVIPNNRLGGSGGRGLGSSVNVTVINNSDNSRVRTEESQDALGGREIRVFIENEIERSINSGRAGRAIQQKFRGLQTQTVSR